MAIRNSEGKLISYECSELIKEPKMDFAEFGGDFTVFAVMKNIHGVNMAIDYSLDKYDFELYDGESLKAMTITALLTLLELENEII